MTATADMVSDHLGAVVVVHLLGNPRRATYNLRSDRDGGGVAMTRARQPNHRVQRVGHDHGPP